VEFVPNGYFPEQVEPVGQLNNLF